MSTRVVARESWAIYWPTSAHSQISRTARRPVLSLSTSTAQVLYSAVLDCCEQGESDARARIAKLRAILEQWALELTRDEPQFFPSLFSRLLVIERQHALPSDIRADLALLRRSTAVHFGDPAPPAEEIAEEVYSRGLGALCKAIEVTAECAPPPELRRFLAEQPSRLSAEPSERPAAISRDLTAVVVDVGETKPMRVRGGRQVQSCLLSCDSDEMGRVELLLLHRHAYVGDLIWPYAGLNAFGLRETNGGKSLRTDWDSLLVIEPDHLVNATDVAECIGRDGIISSNFLLQRLFSRETSEAIVLGNVANTMFDACLVDEDADFEAIFERTLRRNANWFVLLDSDQLGRIMEAARAQFDVVKAQARRLGRPVSIEPTFLSARYGLQGRLDAMVSHDDGRRMIVELKSGNAPMSPCSIAVGEELFSAGVWPNHAAQTAAYDLLLYSAYRRRPGSTAILYSKDRVQPLRDVATTDAVHRTVLEARNRIVALWHSISRDGATVLQHLKPIQFRGAPGYTMAKVALVDQVSQSSGALERRYFEHFFAFVAREEIASKIGAKTNGEGRIHGFASLWQMDRASKEEAYSVLADLECVSRDEKSGALVFSASADGTRLGAFRRGDIALLYRQGEDGMLDPMSDQLWRCTITEIKSGSVQVVLRNTQQSLDLFADHRLWSLEPDYMDTGYESQYQALFAFLRADSRHKRLLLGVDRPRFADDSTIRAEISSELLADQKRIVRQALLARDYFLIQGPPGTGKTKYVLRELVRQMNANSSDNILLLAFTNRAVDEMCAAVDGVAPFLRLGGEDATDFADRSLRAACRDVTPEQARRLVEGTRVFISTVHSFSRDETVNKLKRFQVAIVDEASQLVEPHLVGILSRVDRFILIGDERQLPAVVQQDETTAIVDDPELRELGLRDLRVSLFERLVERCRSQGWHEAFDMLTNQGRMHADVASFPSRSFYQSRLGTVRPEQIEETTQFSRQSDLPVERLLSRDRVVFIATSPEHAPKVHNGQAALVSELVEAVRLAYGQRFTADTIGVIAPFRAQVASITRAAEKRGLDPSLVTIDTVERYQGSERDIIVLSVAVNHEGMLNAIRSLNGDGSVDRKLNVALTRARSHVIVLGNPSVLRHDVHYRALMEHARAEGAFLTEAELLTMIGGHTRR